MPDQSMIEREHYGLDLKFNSRGFVHAKVTRRRPRTELVPLFGKDGGGPMMLAQSGVYEFYDEYIYDEVEARRLAAIPGVNLKRTVCRDAPFAIARATF